MTKDILLLLQPGFVDPAYSDRQFYCWHCALIEGVVACFPRLHRLVEIERVAWQRPRQRVVQLVGEENQALPLLVLADDAPSAIATGEHEGRRFVAGNDAILRALAARHGIPEAHP